MKISYPVTITSKVPLFLKLFIAVLVLLIAHLLFILVGSDFIVGHHKTFTVSIIICVMLATLTGLLFFDAWKDYKYRIYKLHKDYVEFSSYKTRDVENSPLSNFLGFTIKYAGNSSDNPNKESNTYKVYLIHEKPKKSFPLVRFTGDYKREEVVEYFKQELGLNFIEQDKNKAFVRAR